MEAIGLYSGSLAVTLWWTPSWCTPQNVYLAIPIHDGYSSHDRLLLSTAGHSNQKRWDHLSSDLLTYLHTLHCCADGCWHCLLFLSIWTSVNIEDGRAVFRMDIGFQIGIILWCYLARCCDLCRLALPLPLREILVEAHVVIVAQPLQRQHSCSRTQKSWNMTALQLQNHERRQSIIVILHPCSKFLEPTVQVFTRHAPQTGWPGSHAPFKSCLTLSMGLWGCLTTLACSILSNLS